jgi:hypothetical protein
VTNSAAKAFSFAQLGLLWAAVCALAGCVTNSYPLAPPAPYALLPVDEMMTCNAIAESFRFAARRAARLEYWLSVGPLRGYGFERFPVQRYKGCIVLEPGPAVVYERSKLEGSVKRAPVVLKSRG